MLKLDVDNFEKEIENYEGTALVDFWAEWCGPCKMLAPSLEKFASSNTDVKVGKVNIDESLPIALNFNVEVIPTLILFKDGKEIKRNIGYVTEKEIEKFVKE